MNGLGQIQENIKGFICEKKEMQQQITEIEQKRTELAQIRNEMKSNNANNIEINGLGNQIAELGNKSQELQNKLDFRCHALKTQIGFNIDNLIYEGIRKIRKIDEEIQQLDNKIANQNERDAKYQLQKQEFYLRFGRMPELSNNAVKEIKLQEEENKLCISKIHELQAKIKGLEKDIEELAKAKRDFKNGNWNSIIVTTEESGDVSVQEIGIEEEEEIFIQEINVEEIETIEEIYVEEFQPIEELYVEEFEPIEELYIEEFKEIEENQSPIIESVEKTEEPKSVDQIEELARAIVEEIVAEQTKDLNISNIETENEIKEINEEIITFEEKNNKKEKVIIPLFGQKATISNIVVKFEETELVYKAQMSDGNDIKIYPSKIGTGNVLLRDRQNREECKEILMNYAVTEYKILDKKVVNKIDPLICELLIECAEKYSYDAQELIYNYAMSFSNADSFDVELTPLITYNLSFIEGSTLNRKEKAVINKICKNAKKNNKVDIIEAFTGFKKVKYILKRIFAINNINVLPESKY